MNLTFMDSFAQNWPACDPIGADLYIGKFQTQSFFLITNLSTLKASGKTGGWK